MVEDLFPCCHHHYPFVKLVVLESVVSGKKFLSCVEKVGPSFVVTNHLLDVIQTLSLSNPFIPHLQPNASSDSVTDCT